MLEDLLGNLKLGGDGSNTSSGRRALVPRKGLTALEREEQPPAAEGHLVSYITLRSLLCGGLVCLLFDRDFSVVSGMSKVSAVW